MSAIVTLSIYNKLRSLGYGPAQAWARAMRATA